MVAWYQPQYGKVAHSITGLASFIVTIVICIEVFSKRSAECRGIAETDNFTGRFLFWYALLSVIMLSLAVLFVIGYYVKTGQRPTFIS